MSKHVERSLGNRLRWSSKFLAGPTGFEPATSPVTGERSSQLSYDPTKKKSPRTLTEGLLERHEDLKLFQRDTSLLLYRELRKFHNLHPVAADCRSRACTDDRLTIFVDHNSGVLCVPFDLCHGEGAIES